MAKNYRQIIEDLEKAVRDIESQGISISPLNKAIEDLKTHSENIEAVEKNINAVKAEVITPIKLELDENKKAGKFSVWGFYVGAFGLLVTAISLLYSTFNKPSDHSVSLKYDSSSNYNIERTLTELNYSIHGLNENYLPAKNEIFLGQFESATILTQDSSKFIIKAYIPPEKKIDDKWYPMVSLNFYINDKMLGSKGIKEIISIVNNSKVAYFEDILYALWLSENDEFVYMNKYKFKIKRIYRTESQILTVCDNKAGVLIQRLN